MKTTHRLRTIRNGIRAIVLVTVLLMPRTQAQSQVINSYDLTWFSVQSGGGIRSTGGNFELSGTIGQWETDVITAGVFTLRGGFWPSFGHADSLLFGDGFESRDTARQSTTLSRDTP